MPLNPLNSKFNIPKMRQIRSASVGRVSRGSSCTAGTSSMGTSPAILKFENFTSLFTGTLVWKFLPEGWKTKTEKATATPYTCPNQKTFWIPLVGDPKNCTSY